MLEYVPGALELHCCLDHWERTTAENMLPPSTSVPGAPLPPRRAVQLCYDGLNSLPRAGFESTCIPLLEELNKEISNILQRSPVGRSDSAGSTPADVQAATQAASATDPAVTLAGGVVLRTPDLDPASGVSLSDEDNGRVSDGDSHSDTGAVGPRRPTEGPLPFARGISAKENDIFIALFRVVKATPRKIKRVVNV